MFANTLTLTPGSGSYDLIKINQDKYSSEYYGRFADREFTMNIRNTFSTQKGTTKVVDRHNVEIIETVFGTAPAPNVVRKAYLVFEVERGDAAADNIALVNGLVEFLVDATVAKLINRES